MKPLRIDLNCDLGEGAGHDAELMPWITSANIACGGHAGDNATMRETIRLAVAAGVAIGAHPGFEDREHFGRRELALGPAEVRALVIRQVERLLKIASELGAPVVHVKPHGALYNLAARVGAVADVIADAVRTVDSRLTLVGLAGSELVRAGERAGLQTAHEVFADRRYESNGSLTPRSRSDTLITDEVEAVEQVLGMLRRGIVRARDGTEIAVRADTVCLHGDGDHAVDFARRLRTELDRAGIEVGGGYE
jgi:5-oxoprolinase (ATP-hydrolysing) subunit A